jgi:hypothetical protein
VICASQNSFDRLLGCIYHLTIAARDGTHICFSIRLHVGRSRITYNGDRKTIDLRDVDPDEVFCGPNNKRDLEAWKKLDEADID